MISSWHSTIVSWYLNKLGVLGNDQGSTVHVPARDHVGVDCLPSHAQLFFSPFLLLLSFEARVGLACRQTMQELSCGAATRPLQVPSAFGEGARGIRTTIARLAFGVPAHKASNDGAMIVSSVTLKLYH